MYLRTFEITKLLISISEAILALLALLSLLIWVAYKVKQSSPGPILLKQDRHGWDGEIIKVWKFGSMKLHTEEKGTITQAKANDDRVTPFGKFIRRTSIDELPQLFNVIQGTLSLVGPRPHAVEHNDYYVEKIKAYFARHRIKPGITGLAQISGSRGETETVEKMQQRLEYDLSYINNWSLLTDIKILIKTPMTLFGKNIY